jgi:hypothetical protein
MLIDLNILLINCLWCLGVHVLLTYEFSIVNKFGNYFEMYLPEWIHKPLFTCPPCMASIHGVLFALPAYHLSLAIPIHLVCLCALNTLVIYALGALHKYVYGD